jgi:hypothetical protein
VYMFQNGPQPPHSGWSGPPTNMSSGLISPPDSRRTSDNMTEPPPPIQTAPPHRQSLPSIHEALSSGGSRPNPYASPVSASLPPSHQLPYSQSQAPSTSRTYSTEHAPYQPQLAPPQPRGRSPPQPVEPHPHPLSRTESIPTNFPENRHTSSTTSLQTAPGPPPNPYAAPRYEPSGYEQESRAPERTNGFTHHPPPSQSASYQNGCISPGHMPPAGPPGPSFNRARYEPRDGKKPVDNGKLRTNGYKDEVPEFQHGLKRQFDGWEFENNLAQVIVWFDSCVNSNHLNRSTQTAESSWNGPVTTMPSLKNSSAA